MAMPQAERPRGTRVALLEGRRPTLVPMGTPRPSGAGCSSRVALVHLGNQGALGTTRRVLVWKELLGASGIDVLEVNLLRDHHRPVPSALSFGSALRGTVVPETAMWSARHAARAIRSAGADTAVFVTARAFHPELARVVRAAVLDFQDLFSRSYRGRAAVDRRPGAAAAWRMLAWATERFERRDRRVRPVVAGWCEAQETGATWIPNTITCPVPAGDVTDHADARTDLLFFGKLTALPNLDAIRRLAGYWPQLTDAVPGATCTIAGSGANEEVGRLAAGCGWHVEQDFADVNDLCARARVGVVPLRYANGIQNKVLEAAAAGLPQVLSSVAVRGVAPGFPALIADDPATMAGAVSQLLRVPAHRLALAHRAHDHVVSRYSTERWVDPVRDLITGNR